MKGPSATPKIEMLKTVASKLFKKVTQSFSLKYKEIQNLINGTAELSLKGTFNFCVLVLRTFVCMDINCCLRRFVKFGHC